MKKLALVVMVATLVTLTGCAIVPYGPPVPVYVGVHGGYHDGHGGWRY